VQVGRHSVARAVIADLYADLQVDMEQFEIVAPGGMPISFHDPRRRVEFKDHLLVPPAGRVEAIVTGPTSGAQASLRTRCYDTGPDGDSNPAMVLADINGKKYRPSDAPMRASPSGGFHHWRLVNNTHEVHPFHIHQIHFLARERDASSTS
jgi:suppressor of ftsI